MSPTIITQEALTASFPNSTLPRIEGRPARASIDDTVKALQQNASSVSSELAGGSHGHLALTMHAAVYAILTGGAAFAVPQNPGAIPLIPPNLPADQVRVLQATHEEALRIWRLYNTVQDSLKGQLQKVSET